jgi:16S rRNA (uracil1498-N3)-methyltransferase
VAGDGQGRWVVCRVTAAGGRRPSSGGAGLLEPDGDVLVDPPVGPPVTIAFAPVKGDRPEWVVQKLTEQGVDRIVPLVTARSVVRWDGDRADRALTRLRRVAREASAQCRRAHLPEITAVTTLDRLVADSPGPVSPAQPGGDPPSLRCTTLAVGPEGGWDAAELAVGAPPTGLGPTVLRAETAAVVAAALLCGLRAGTVAPAGESPG